MREFISRFRPDQLVSHDRRQPNYRIVVFVTDFGDRLATAQCQLALTRTALVKRKQPPHFVSVEDVLSFNKTHAAFNLQQLARDEKDYPVPVIFVGVVDPEVGTARDGLIIETERHNHIFIGPNNGILYPAAMQERIRAVWKIDEARFGNHSRTFHGRDIFAPAAAEIASGTKSSALGERIDQSRLIELSYQRGQILHIDRFGNYVINDAIPDGTVSACLETEKFERIELPVRKTFADVEIGSPLIYTGSSGDLPELAIREGKAASVFGFQIEQCLTLHWQDGHNVFSPREFNENNLYNEGALPMRYRREPLIPIAQANVRIVTQSS